MKTKLLVTLLLGISTSSQASLIDRGNGLLYDNVLDITWLQDANYARTSHYVGADSSGKMDWATATTWAADLVFGGYSDWRLASNSPVNGSSFNYNFAVNGSTDYSYNITSPKSELSYMYYVNLDLKGYVDATGKSQPDVVGIFRDGTTDVGLQDDVDLVKNLQSNLYWSGTKYAAAAGNAWIFGTFNGLQYQNDNSDLFNAWAVRPGDVAIVPAPAPVPVPAAFWLFGSGLIGLTGLKRRGNIG